MLATRRLSEALTAFECATAAGADPDRCSAGRWLASMLAGDFAQAWLESDATRARGTPDPHRVWNGESLAGRHVIVRCLHGFGDTVQGMRYAGLLRQLAASVVFEVPPRMAALARCFAGADHVVTWDDPPPAWDLQIEITELPYIFRTSLLDLPVARNYLALPNAVVDNAAAAMGSTAHRRISVVWTGGEWDLTRSIPFALLRPLLDLPNTELWSLQAGPAAANAQLAIDAGQLRDATAVCGDGLLPLAATIANLDLVITVDTLAAHLAGAMGKPVWVMLQHAADWRWMTHREDSPWYPSMRLFRQPRPGDWSGVVAAVQQALAIDNGCR